MSSHETSTEPSTNSISDGSTSIPRGSKKKIFIIRHAESEENRRIAALSRSFQNLKRFSLPKMSDLSSSTELLNVSAQVDSNVSDIGASQIAHMGEKLRNDKFIESSGIELVVHSPLLRARQTSEGMLGCVAALLSDDIFDEKRNNSVSRVTETSLLLEKKPSEWTPIYHANFLKRISDFETWLGKQPEQVIVLVGHSQYFKAMLGLEYKFNNCEVWKVEFDVLLSGQDASQDASAPSSTFSGDNDCKGNPCWSNLEKVYSCEIEASPKSL